MSKDSSVVFFNAGVVFFNVTKKGLQYKGLRNVGPFLDFSGVEKNKQRLFRNVEKDDKIYGKDIFYVGIPGNYNAFDVFFLCCGIMARHLLYS